jgi:hypothetical protein
MTEMRNEMGQMATYFGVCEKLDLAGARTDARTEAWSETGTGRFGEAALKRSAEMINWYRKLDPRVKIALSVSLMAGGLGAAAMGSFGVASVVGGTKLLQRWLGGAALGAGIAGGLEARSRNKANQTAEKGRGAIFENSEASWQEQLQALNEYCGNEMRNFHDGLQDEKYGATRRKLLGAGVGVFVGSGAAATLLREGFSWVGHTEIFGKVKDVATGLWKSSGAGGIVGAGIESIKGYNPFGSSGGGAVEHGLRDTPASKLGPSANGMEEKFGMDEKFGLKGAQGSSIENGLRDNPSSKLASKVGGMYDEIADKVKGAAGKFEKDYLQGTPSAEKVPFSSSVDGDLRLHDNEVKVPSGPKEAFSSSVDGDLRLHPDDAPTHAGASDGDRFHPRTEATHAGASDGDRFNPVEAPTNPNIKDLKINGSIERTIIRQLQEQGISKPDAGKFAHRMALKYVEDYNIAHPNAPITFESLNHVQPEDNLKLNIDPNNLDKSGIVSFERASDNLHTGGANATGIPNRPEVGNSGRSPIAEAAEKPATPDDAGVEKNVSDARQEAQRVARARSVDMGNSTIDTPTQEEYQKLYGRSEGAYVVENIQAMPASIRLHEGELFNLGKLKSVAEEAFNRASADTNDISYARRDALELAKRSYETAYADIFNKLARETFAGHPVKGGLIGLKNISADQFLEGDGGQNSKIMDMKNYIAKQFGEKFSEPEPRESAFKWVNRMIQETLKSGGVEYKNYKILDNGRG